MGLECESSITSDAGRVHVEFQRVQTWLFAVPRLRAMVGANAMLGEVLRHTLRDLARKETSWRLAPLAAPGDYRANISADPLADDDDPASDARVGIIARDGGHFEAYFASARDANAFAAEADALLRRELPGLRFRIAVGNQRAKSACDGVPLAAADLSTELPVLTPCEWTGRGLASEHIQQGNERAFVSREVARRHEAAKRAERGTANDLATKLVAVSQLGERLRQGTLKRAGTFDELAGSSGYLALIHADGNGVGSGAPGALAARARFFHRNRVLLRRALQAALDHIAADHPPTMAGTDPPIAPLQPLMLGGDDLLAVCRADVAFDFVMRLCATLADIQRDEPAAFNLTLGVGIVIARYTIPIERLHDVAEQLASSAKRRFRGFGENEPRSVVDWAVYTASMIDAPEEVRRRDWLRGKGDDERVLSRRPLDVLGEGLDSLEGLRRAAKCLAGPEHDGATNGRAAPRSQLHYLIEQLPLGRTLSELAFNELSSATRRALDRAGVTAVWERANGAPAHGDLWLTSLLDLFEVAEINRLAPATAPPATPVEAAHGAR